MSRKIIVLSILMTLLIMYPAVGSAQQKIYWVDQTNQKIQRADLDGTNVVDVITGLVSPEGLALDISGGKVYWTERTATGKIHRADLDGTNTEELVTGLNNPDGIALDIAGSKMYWAAGSVIQRANLDGTNVESLITTGLLGADGIALDLINGKMYWTDNGNQDIQRANLDGTSVEKITDITHSQGIALDISSEKIYWSDEGIPGIHRVNFDGTGFERLVGPQTFNGQVMALDADTGKIYWGFGNPKDNIQRSDLDGSNVEAFITGLTGVGQIQLDLSPIGLAGDANEDGRVSVLDIILTVRIILGSSSAPAQGTAAFVGADANGDASIDILDIIKQVNLILNIDPPVSKSAVPAPITVHMDGLRPAPDHRRMIPVRLSNAANSAGIQMTFTFDPRLLRVDTPVLHTTGNQVKFDYFIEDGVLRLVVYSHSADQHIVTEGMPFISIPAMPLGHEESTLTLADITVADRHARAIPVTIDQPDILIRPGHAGFTLSAATPNPFNPQTAITYTAPVRGHITLTVYNLLGQEVIRLVDEVKGAGRHTVVWHGTDSRGHSVASGIYLYRLTGEGGQAETRRMILLK